MRVRLIQSRDLQHDGKGRIPRNQALIAPYRPDSRPRLGRQRGSPGGIVAPIGGPVQPESGVGHGRHYPSARLAAGVYGGHSCTGWLLCMCSI